ITQLRSGHVGLNALLARIKAITSSLCPLCGVPITVDRYLFSCRRFVQKRHDLCCAVRGKYLTRKVLLGNVQLCAALLAFVHATGRFSSYSDLGPSSQPH
ncbi:hypothetical protein K523DRAFT_235722, partial [Schizophyllum commune Tattone D]